MSTYIYYKLITPFKSKENNKYNYVYQITEISTGTKYIGSRGSTTEPNKDIKKYKSSSTDKQFKLNQKLNPLNYWYEILSYHETREDANIEESRLHDMYNVGCSDTYFNKSNQTKNGFTTEGKVTVIDKDGTIMQVSTTDERYINGELIGVAAGTVTVKDKDGNAMRVSIDDERYLSGEFKHIHSGKIAVKDKDGNTLWVSTTDERYINGELIGVATGKVTVKDKDGNTLQVSTTDERYINGELKPVNLGKLPVRDKDGNILQVSNTDERYLSGEFKHIHSGKIAVKDKDGNTMRVSKDDERYLNGDLIGVKAKWLTIEGETISSTTATKKYNISRSTVLARVKSTDPKWSEWRFM